MVYGDVWQTRSQILAVLDHRYFVAVEKQFQNG